MVYDALPVLDLADLYAGPEAVERFREQLRVAAGERVVIFHLQADEVLPTLRAALDER